MVDYAVSAILVVVAYLMGSIPFAIVVGKGFWHVDVREHGSGNVGTTNVFRVLGSKAGIVVLIGDMAKGLPARPARRSPICALDDALRRDRRPLRPHVLDLPARPRRQGRGDRRRSSWRSCPPSSSSRWRSSSSCC